MTDMRRKGLDWNAIDRLIKSASLHTSLKERQKNNLQLYELGCAQHQAMVDDALNKKKVPCSPSPAPKTKRRQLESPETLSNSKKKIRADPSSLLASPAKEFTRQRLELQESATIRVDPKASPVKLFTRQQLEQGLAFQDRESRKLMAPQAGKTSAAMPSRRLHEHTLNSRKIAGILIAATPYWANAFWGSHIKLPPEKTGTSSSVPKGKRVHFASTTCDANILLEHAGQPVDREKGYEQLTFTPNPRPVPQFEEDGRCIDKIRLFAYSHEESSEKHSHKLAMSAGSRYAAESMQKEVRAANGDEMRALCLSQEELEIARQEVDAMYPSFDSIISTDSLPERVDADQERALLGLQNIRNSCYMNSVLHFLKWLLGGHCADLDLTAFSTKPGGLHNKRDLATALWLVLIPMERTGMVPRHLLVCLRAILFRQPIFAGSGTGIFDQQDAMEAMTVMLDSLYETNCGTELVSTQLGLEQCIMRTMARCDSCKLGQRMLGIGDNNFVRMFNLALTAHDKSIKDLLIAEMVEDDEVEVPCYSSTCGGIGNQKHKRTTFFADLPSKLAISLKRFHTADGPKVRYRVAMEETLQLREHHIDKDLQDTLVNFTADDTVSEMTTITTVTYEPAVIIVHTGETMSSGHYFCICKIDGVWYVFDDDSEVVSVTWANIKRRWSRDCYAIGYQRLTNHTQHPWEVPLPDSPPGSPIGNPDNGSPIGNPDNGSPIGNHSPAPNSDQPPAASSEGQPPRRNDGVRTRSQSTSLDSEALEQQKALEQEAAALAAHDRLMRKRAQRRLAAEKRHDNEKGGAKEPSACSIDKDLDCAQIDHKEASCNAVTKFSFLLKTVKNNSPVVSIGSHGFGYRELPRNVPDDGETHFCAADAVAVIFEEFGIPKSLAYCRTVLGPNPKFKKVKELLQKYGLCVEDKHDLKSKPLVTRQFNTVLLISTRLTYGCGGTSNHYIVYLADAERRWLVDNGNGPILELVGQISGNKKTKSKQARALFDHILHPAITSEIKICYEITKVE